MKYQISHEKDEILRAIKEAKSKKKNLIWQTFENERHVSEVDSFGFDPVREIVQFKGLKLDTLCMEKPVYIKLAHRNTIFKGHILFKDHEGVYLKVPDEVRFEELREFPRFEFKYSESRTIKLAVATDFTSNSNEHHEVSLLDLSQSGMGIALPPALKNFLLSGNELRVSSLGQYDFKSKFTIDPVYNSSYFGAEIDLEKVGFQFKEKLPENLLSNYMRYEEGLFAHQIGFLGRSKKFRKKLHREYQQMLWKLNHKNKFFDFFNSSSNIEGLGDDYLPRHIRLHAMVSCALAKLLNIEDKEVYAQLTYACFVHDLAFFTNPKLAQIKHHDHFDKVKSYLTFSEKELFFRAPNYAYEFSLSDKNAPAGSEFILLQSKDYLQNDNPDLFLAKGGISPLVAIYIVAHDLTDYILDHPKWTFYEYLQQYRFLRFGGVFAEIFESLNSARETA